MLNSKTTKDSSNDVLRVIFFFFFLDYFYDCIRIYHRQSLLYLNTPHEAYACTQYAKLQWVLLCKRIEPAREISGICFVVSCNCCLLLTFEKGIGCIWQKPSVNTKHFLPLFPTDNPISEINIIFERSYYTHITRTTVCRWCVCRTDEFKENDVEKLTYVFGFGLLTIWFPIIYMLIASFT